MILVSARLRSILGAAAAWALLPVVTVAATGSARAEDAPAKPDAPVKPLRFTVNPSQYGRETLDQKLARRTRQSEFLFRFICSGCTPGETAAARPAGAFDPQATLNGSPPPSRVVETVENPADPGSSAEAAGAKP